MAEADDRARIEAEAAAFRGLIAHLQKRSDVQNIDLMNLAGFCRNCLAKWLAAGARVHGADLDYDQARDIVYGMPFAEWKERHQGKASAEQLQRFEDTKPLHAIIDGF